MRIQPMLPVQTKLHDALATAGQYKVKIMTLDPFNIFKNINYNHLNSAILLITYSPPYSLHILTSNMCLK